MRVFHIIPSAFDYFDDIRGAAFSLVDGINELGLEAEPITLQYGPPSREARASVQEATPSLKLEYAKEEKFAAVEDEFQEYDIVHLHCPFFAAAPRLIKWKKSNMGHPLVVTYYRDVPFTDLFSLLIRWYNNYYLPKLFFLADAVTCFSWEDFKKSLGRKYLADKAKLTALGGSPENVHLTEGKNLVRLMNKKEAIANLANLYERLI